VQLPVPVATYLLNEKRDELSKIESRMKVRIVIIPNLHLDSPNYKIKKISADSPDNDNKLSFNLVDENEDLAFEPQNNKAMNANKALVKNFAPSEKAPVLNKSFLGRVATHLTGLFKKSLTQKAIKPKSVEANPTTHRHTSTNKPAKNATAANRTPRTGNSTTPNSRRNSNIATASGGRSSSRNQNNRNANEPINGITEANTIKVHHPLTPAIWVRR
jgi:ribonuclease E